MEVAVLSLTYFYDVKKSGNNRFAAVLPYLKNKYLLTLVGFLVWLSFFDKNDFITTWSYRQKLNQLRAEKSYYESEIEKNKKYLEHLRTRPENLERFAREKYLMKKENEEIFVVLEQQVD